MSEWLDLMLDEVARKEREEREALQEVERRAEQERTSKPALPKPAQSK
jgi:hypothetical protein